MKNKLYYTYIIISLHKRNNTKDVNLYMKKLIKITICLICLVLYIENAKAEDVYVEYNGTSYSYSEFISSVSDSKGSMADTPTYRITFVDKNGKELNISICQNTPVIITNAIIDDNALNYISGEYYSKLGINIYDSSDPYFNDICYKIMKNETKITLN